MAAINIRTVIEWVRLTALALSATAIIASSGCGRTATTSSQPVASPPVVQSLPSFASAVSKALPCICYVYVETNQTDASGNPVSGIGSGVILSSDGWILTNKHVVNDYKSVEVTLYDRHSYAVSKVVVDDIADLAAVKIERQGLPSLPIGNPDSVKVGDWVIAIGHALGISPAEGGPTVTEGVVSSLGRSFTMNDIPYYDLIQTSAAINPGNSGGALMNSAGELVGLNSAGVPSAQGIGYAINIGTAKHVFDDLVKYGKPRHPFLGVRVTDVSPEAARNYHVPFESALVDYVEAGSPAETAGLRVGDAIVGLSGENVTSAADVMKVLWRHESGDKSTLIFLHRGLKNSQDIQFMDRPQTDSI